MLISLFGYPGSGHFLLKRPRRGLVWVALFSLAFASAFGSFAFNLFRLYTGATSLSAIDVSAKDWTPTLILVAISAVVWMGAAVDAAFCSKQA